MRAGAFEHGPDPVKRIAEVPIGLPPDCRGAPGRPNQPEEHPESSRLARAVRSQESGDGAGLDLKAQPVDSEDTAEPLGELMSLDQCHERGSWRSRGGKPSCRSSGGLRPPEPPETNRQIA